MYHSVTCKKFIKKYTAWLNSYTVLLQMMFSVVSELF